MSLKSICSLSVLAFAVAACTVTTTNNNDDDETTDGTGGKDGSDGAAGSAGSESTGTDGSDGSEGGAAGSDDGTDGSDAGSGGLDDGSQQAVMAGAFSSDGTGGSDDTSGAGGAGGSASDDSQLGGDAGASETGQGGTPSTVPAGTDSCDDGEDPPNNTREEATAYTLGTDYQGCTQDTTDVDVYEFTIPDDSRGGYVQVSLTDVGTDGDLDITVFSGLDNGSFLSNATNSVGTNLYLYFTAAPGASFHISVEDYNTVNAPNPYTFNATYVQVPDTHEPNDSRPEATAISVGEEVEGYMLGDRETSTGIPNENWFDWYQVDLEAGTVTALLSIVASDIDGSITLFDPLGSQIANNADNTDGSSVQLEYTIEEAGAYYVRINPYSAPPPQGTTVDVPEFLTTPYTLTVTQ
jgi:hypothetical protein